MSDKKQIDEMAKIIASSCYKSCLECNSEAIDGAACIEVRSAEALYNAGYRKQSEGRWIKHRNEKTCSQCKFVYYSNNDDWNFCPNCCAKMKGGKE